jgi:hypothetical protein
MSTHSSPPVFHGSCLCGRLRYEVLGPIKAVTHCHCSMCRKAHGAAFGTYGSVPLEHFVVTEGAGHRRSYPSSPGVERSFCVVCGSTLTWHRNEGEFSRWIAFALGTLDTPFVPARQKQVHADCAAAWYTGN